MLGLTAVRSRHGVPLPGAIFGASVAMDITTHEPPNVDPLHMLSKH